MFWNMHCTSVRAICFTSYLVSNLLLSLTSGNRLKSTWNTSRGSRVQILASFTDTRSFHSVTYKRNGTVIIQASFPALYTSITLRRDISLNSLYAITHVALNTFIVCHHYLILELTHFGLYSTCLFGLFFFFTLFSNVYYLPTDRSRTWAVNICIPFNIL